MNLYVEIQVDMCRNFAVNVSKHDFLIYFLNVVNGIFLLFILPDGARPILTFLSKIRKVYATFDEVEYL